jgi:biotin carboxylase
MPRLLMVGCGWMGRPYLARAHTRGLAVAVLDSAAAFTWPETKAALGPADRGYIVRGSDTEAWLVAAAEALADGPVDAVVAFSEPHVLAAALLAEELGLPGPGLRAATTSRNKLLQRCLFARHGIAQPEHVLARAAHEALAWARGRYPVVAKPLSNSGSLGVEIIKTAADLRRWVSATDSDRPFLVEEYLTGREYSVEAVVVDGNVVFSSLTAKIITGPPYCVELEHWIPGSYDPRAVSAAQTVLGQVVQALGMGSGLVHLELKFEPDGPHVVEVAVRTPGDYLTDGVQAATGVDIYDCAIAVALGSEAPVARTLAQDVCIWFPTAEPGPIAEITDSQTMGQLEGVVKAEIDYEPGGEVHPLLSSMDRLGVVIVAGAGAAQLRARADRVKSAFTVTTGVPALV